MKKNEMMAKVREAGIVFYIMIFIATLTPFLTGYDPIITSISGLFLLISMIYAAVIGMVYTSEYSIDIFIAVMFTVIGLYVLLTVVGVILILSGYMIGM